MPKAFYSTSEIAEILSVTPNTAREMMRMWSMQGRAMRISNRYRIRMSAFDRWLAEQERAT